MSLFHFLPHLWSSLSLLFSFFSIIPFNLFFFFTCYFFFLLIIFHFNFSSFSFLLFFSFSLSFSSFYCSSPSLSSPSPFSFSYSFFSLARATPRELPRRKRRGHVTASEQIRIIVIEWNLLIKSIFVHYFYQR